ncbi:MAG: hypothetical protein R6U91_03895 [Bacillota bacterium]
MWNELNQEDIQAMLAEMIHRGPDAAGEKILKRRRESLDIAA